MKQPTDKTIGMRIAVLAIIERMDELEEAGADFTFAKNVILRWARKNEIFDTPSPF